MTAVSHPPQPRQATAAPPAPRELLRAVTTPQKLRRLLFGLVVLCLIWGAVAAWVVNQRASGAKEGPIPYTYRMTVMQALSEAGGINEYAKKKAIYILRTDPDGKAFRYPFDYAAVLKGQRLELNIKLMPGDMIVVP